MLKKVASPDNKNKLAIVVVGYNKLFGLQRLLDSLNRSIYDSCDIPLVISIDASGNEDVYRLANDYQWEHGKKYVNIEKERLGLKSHIMQCASLTKYFKGVIILEDDILVSPYFYHYATTVLDFYANDTNVAGIALYKNENEGFNGLPLQYVHSGYDVFAWQAVCSWGEIWNERMWNDFKSWLDKWDEDFDPIDMPDRIKKWQRAWSKYYYSYMIINKKYFIYPYQPLTTNFNDAGGEHGGGNHSIFQVSLMQGKKNYQLGAFNDLVKYDVYLHNEDLPKWLGVQPEDLTIDFYGLKEMYKGHYILTPFDLPLPYKRVKGFSLSMRPWELNVKYNIEGNDLVLYYRKTSEDIKPPKRRFKLSLGSYFLRGFNIFLLRDYVFTDAMNRIKKRLGLK